MSTSQKAPKGKSKSKKVTTVTDAQTPKADAKVLGKTWDELPTPLSESVLSVINEVLKFPRMTPVQENTIPLLMSHKDVVVEALTGSGKTLAYIIPVLEIILRKRKEEQHNPNDLDALIICPTRELAVQVYQVAKLFQEATSVNVHMLVGGTERILTMIDGIVVGTPGRLVEVFQNTRAEMLNPKALEVLILDEADRILDMGFEKQVNAILNKLPKQRRTGLFSATLPQVSNNTAQQQRLMTIKDALGNLVRSGLRNPHLVVLKQQPTANVSSKNSNTAKQNASDADSSTPMQLVNFYMICDNDHKLDQFIRVLIHEHNKLTSANSKKAEKKESFKMIVYFLTCACVDYYAKVLQSLSESLLQLPLLNISSLHGQMVPKRRTGTYDAFVQAQEGLQVLLCTDVAARGLDIPDVSMIVQFDPPVDPNVFIHRVGRTARMGKSGSSLVFLTPEEDAYVEYLRIKKVPMQEMKQLTDATAPLPQIPAIEFPSYIRSKVTQQNTTTDDSDDSGSGSESEQVMDDVENESPASENEAEEAEEASATSDESENESASTSQAKSDDTPAATAPVQSVLLPYVKQHLALRDREIFEKGLRAFISYVRAYKEHICNFIFRLKRFKFQKLADSFTLFKAPSMPETRGYKFKLDIMVPSGTPNRRQPLDIDLNAIPYRDEKREKARLSRLRSGVSSKGKKEDAQDVWHVKHEAKAKREAIRETVKNKKRKRWLLQGLDQEELLKETKLMKQLQAGKITKEQFEVLVGERRDTGPKNESNLPDGSDDSDDDSSDEDFSKRKKSKKSRNRKGKKRSKLQNIGMFGATKKK